MTLHENFLLFRGQTYETAFSYVNKNHKSSDTISLWITVTYYSYLLVLKTSAPLSIPAIFIPRLLKNLLRFEPSLLSYFNELSSLTLRLSPYLPMFNFQCWYPYSTVVCCSLFLHLDRQIHHHYKICHHAHFLMRPQKGAYG